MEYKIMSNGRVLVGTNMDGYNYKNTVLDVLDIKEKFKELHKYVSNLDKDWNGNLSNISKTRKWISHNSTIVNFDFYISLFADLTKFISNEYDEIELHIIRLRIMQEIERRFYSVYKHTCPNRKVYIGVTCSEEADYRWVSGFGYKYNEPFYQDIQKYGWDNIRHEILFYNLSPKEASQREQDLILQYKSNDSNYGYNIDKGGKLLKPIMGLGELFEYDFIYQYRARRRPYKFIVQIDHIGVFESYIARINSSGTIQEKRKFEYKNEQYYFIIASHPSYNETHQITGN